MVSPPEWLESFANEVAANIISFDVLSPIGCHFQLVTDIWEVTIFVSETEVVGGSQDGKRISCPFSLDVKKISELFSQIDGMAWQNQSLDLHDEIGLHFAIEGQYLNQQVLLRVTATAPVRFEAGRRAVVNSRRFEELW